MERHYNIIITIKTPFGRREIGNFYIGDDLEFALLTFSALNGFDDADVKSVLRIELVEKRTYAAAESLAGLSCTLDQYVENCRIIACDAFKFFTLLR